MTSVLPFDFRRFLILRPYPGKAFDHDTMGAPVSGAFLRVSGRSFTSDTLGVVRVPQSLTLTGHQMIWGIGEEIYQEGLDCLHDPRSVMVLFMGRAPLYHEARELILQR